MSTAFEDLAQGQVPFACQDRKIAIFCMLSRRVESHVYPTLFGSWDAGSIKSLVHFMMRTPNVSTNAMSSFKREKFHYLHLVSYQ